MKPEFIGISCTHLNHLELIYKWKSKTLYPRFMPKTQQPSEQTQFQTLLTPTPSNSSSIPITSNITKHNKNCISF